MTEAEWLECANPERMFRFLLGRVSDRKWRLFACGWCRLNWEKLIDHRSRHAVELAERFADGLASAAELEGSFQAAVEVSVALSSQDDAWERGYWTAAAWADSCANVSATAWANAAEASHPSDDELSKEASLLREVLGNPFQNQVANPAWLTPTVISLATAIYEERAFDRSS